MYVCFWTQRKEFGRSHSKLLVMATTPGKGIGSWGTSFLYKAQILSDRFGRQVLLILKFKKIKKDLIKHFMGLSNLWYALFLMVAWEYVTYIVYVNNPKWTGISTASDFSLLELQYKSPCIPCMYACVCVCICMYQGNIQRAYALRFPLEWR